MKVAAEKLRVDPQSLFQLKGSGWSVTDYARERRPRRRPSDGSSAGSPRLKRKRKRPSDAKGENHRIEGMANRRPRRRRTRSLVVRSNGQERLGSLLKGFVTETACEKRACPTPLTFGVSTAGFGSFRGALLRATPKIADSDIVAEQMTLQILRE